MTHITPRADYADDEYIQELMAWKHPYIADPDDFQFTEEENLTMLRLPRKECWYFYHHSRSLSILLLDLAVPLQVHNIYLLLVTLLFSYAYDARTTQLDPTPESAWTIGILTPAFSALDAPPYDTNPTTISDPHKFSPSELTVTLMQSYRRSLAFPLYRSFAFAEACRVDVAHLLLKGKRTTIRCLLQIKHILDHHEVYYVYSKIWVDDLCVWLQVNARSVV